MYTGILRHQDIGSGSWTLESDDGSTYTLVGNIPASLVNTRVTLKAKPMQGMGFMMSGPALQVETITQS